ncbi:dTMP kinase [Erythrobacteraceae bacterium CFH 75059]|uniref:dTMP kinase n=1 Tax=Qipengyuania thermophila TaxID=2509361 RepID=UPI0010200B14|nr:dTMP kinase [Qipengyuania thermophila]TCD05201.1 dTMP kinase [Erythrobacteraceae bacterium CFH 75059]
MAAVKGRFITFEGGEGAGKSTQARLLADWLTQQGRPTVLTREPGGTPGAEAIRALLLCPPGAEWLPRAEALLFAAARSDHVERLINPALARGEWVISDRFIDSSLAYQGFAGGLGVEKVTALHTIGTGGVWPDLTLVLRAPAATAAARVTARDGSCRDAIGGRGEAYHSDVDAAFLQLVAAHPQRIREVDASGDADAVHALVRDAVAPLLEGAAR